MIHSKLRLLPKSLASEALKFNAIMLLKLNPMQNLPLDFTASLSPWFAVIAILIATLIAVGLFRVILRTIAKTQRFVVLQRLVSPISNLLYVIGLQMAVEVAPLHPKISLWLGGAVYILGILVLFWIVRRFALVGIEWTAIRANHSPAMQKGFIPVIRNLVTLFVFTSGAIMILKHFDYDVMSLLAALGVGSLAVGLAAKDTLSNMISGFTLIIDRNLMPGDRINLSGSSGEVEEIGLRSTRIRTGTGSVLIVPNSELVNTKILNLSQPSRTASCSTTVKVPYDVPFERFKELCLAALSENSKALKNRPQWVNLSSLAENGQMVTIGFWVADLDHEGVAISEFYEKLVKRLRQERISLTPPAAPPAVVLPHPAN